FTALSLFTPRSAALRHLHSFPTRRSSDLCPAQSSRFVLCHIYYFGISRLSEGLDFGVLWHLIRPRSLRIWFLFVSTDTAVWLTSDRKSTRLNSSHVKISYAVFCLKKKKHP